MTAFSPKRQRHQLLVTMRAESHSVIGMLAFVELHRRIHDGAFGSVDRPLRDDAFSMGGYCLDAPGTMPAGGMEDFAIDDEDSIPCQLTWSRE